MRNLVPEFILTKTKESNFTGYMNAWVLNIDLRGFTGLAQDLMQKSDAGAEVLTDVINAIFSPAINAIETRNGFIAIFAGDAFTALFSDNDMKHAVNSALAVRDFFIENGTIQTEFGEYQLSAKLGLAHGQVKWTIVCSKEQHIYWFSGDGIEKAVAAQKNALPNTLAIENTMLGQINDPIAKVATIDSTHSLLLSTGFPDSKINHNRSFLSEQAFIPEQISSLKIVGEFREVLSCFINVAEPDDKQIRSILALCENYGGYFNKVDCTDKGWVALVLFGAPIAFDRMSTRSIEFAIEVNALNPTHTRIGLSYGKAYAGFVGSDNRGEYTALGMSVNLAARYMMTAAFGEIWLDKHIRTETDSTHLFEYLGALEYKGFPYNIATHKLLCRQQHHCSQFYTRDFVGREIEMQMLKSSCDALWESRFAGITYIYGDAGQGKSRLVYEIQEVFRERAQCYFLQTDSIHRTPLSPFVYWIRYQFTSILTGELEERIADFRRLWLQFTQELKDIQGVEDTIKELDRAESVLAGLIGLDWEGSLYASLESKYRPSVIGFALKVLLEAYCLIKPVVLIIEDLHWLDKESEDVIQILTRRASNLPFKLVLTSRPKDDGTLPTVKHDSDVQIDSVCLSGLNQGQVKSLMGSILAGNISSELAEYVLSISQGNPFITEQLSNFLHETDQLTCHDNAYYLREKGGQLPAGVQALLVARLDRLEADLKRTVQTASILGREFAVVILREMLESLEDRPAFLNEMIVQSQLHEGEQEHIWNELNEIIYIFSHSLLREAAYAMQLSKQLKRLHQLAGQIMLKHYSEDKTKLRDIAEHFEKAGECEKAILFFHEAGNFEADQFHFDACILCFETALKLCVAKYGDIHIETANNLVVLANAYKGKGQYDKMLECCQRAYLIKKGLMGEESEEAVDSMFYLANAHHILAEWEIAQELFEAVLKHRKVVYGELNLKVADCYDSLAAICTHNYPNDFTQALKYCLMAHDIIASVCEEKHPRFVQSILHLGLTHCNVGEVEVGMEFYERGLKLTREIYGPKHPRVINAISGLGYAYGLKGDFAKSLELNKESLFCAIDLLGEGHPGLSNYYYNVGVEYMRIEAYELAHELWNKSLICVINAYGENNPIVGHAYNNLGDAMFASGDFKRALDYHFTSLGILNDKHETFPTSTLSLYKFQCLEKICDTLEQMGDHEKAIEYKVMAEILGKRV